MPCENLHEFGGQVKINRRSFLKIAAVTFVAPLGTISKLVYANNDRKQESEFSVLSCVATPLAPQSKPFLDKSDSFI